MTDFNGEQYKRVMAACKERDKIPTQAWTPDEEKCVHTQLYEADQHKLILNDIDFTKDSEYVKLFGQQSDKNSRNGNRGQQRHRWALVI